MGVSLSTLTGDLLKKFSFYATREVLERVLAFRPLGKLSSGVWKQFWVVRVAFWQFFLSFGDGFLDPFQKAFEVVALCTSHAHLKHLAAQPNVSTTS